MIKVLIVDDSITETKILKHIFESAKDIEIIGYASNGHEAIKMVETLKPDLITMDINMPLMDGFEAIKVIMSHTPTPIIVISSSANDKELNTTFKSLEAGALSVLSKPTNIGTPEFSSQSNRIIHMVRTMAEIKVIKRRFFTQTAKQKPHVSTEFKHRRYQMIAIGTSVGGPQVLKTILSGLSGDFPVPIAVVQHMTHGFLQGFTSWLNNNITLNVKLAEQNEILNAGTVYFAPDKMHLKILKHNDSLVANLVDEPPVSGFCPSATVLLQSVAKSCGKNAVGVLLTGMGSDGAKGLLALKEAGGHTLIQDPDSAVVFGMAGVAQSLGAVDEVVKLDQFSDYLTAIFTHAKTHPS